MNSADNERVSSSSSYLEFHEKFRFFKSKSTTGTVLQGVGVPGATKDPSVGESEGVIGGDDSTSLGPLVIEPFREIGLQSVREFEPPLT